MRKKLTREKLREMILENLQEADIGSFIEDITVQVDVSKTRHATNRQTRHSTKITDDEIVATAEAAADDILQQVLMDQIDIGDEIVIRDKTYDLNLVCKLQAKSEDEYRLVVETVMIKKNFKPKNPSDKVIDIY